jgi:hypothetical protein
VWNLQVMSSRRVPFLSGVLIALNFTHLIRFIIERFLLVLRDLPYPRHQSELVEWC